MSEASELYEQQLHESKMIVAREMEEPFFIYRPRLFIDGDQWCALYGENLQDGVAGFGKSPELARVDFNCSWMKKLP